MQFKGLERCIKTDKKEQETKLHRKHPLDFSKGKYDFLYRVSSFKENR